MSDVIDEARYKQIKILKGFITVTFIGNPLIY